jgi:hypothetical protein
MDLLRVELDAALQREVPRGEALLKGERHNDIVYL